MNDVNNVAASSPATEPVFEVPSDPTARAEWRQTGKLPEPKPEKAEAQPSKEAPAPSAESAAADEVAENLAPASEAGKDTQEPRKSRGNAETRLSELLSDLKRARLTPAELKTFKRQAEAAAAGETKADPPPAATSEKPKNYADWRKEFKPKAWLEDWFGKNKDSAYEDGVAAMNDHMNEVRDGYRDAEQTVAAQRKQLSEQLDEAKKRYPDADKTILPTADQIAKDQDMSPVIKAVLNDSPVMMDLLYVLGSKPEDLADFVETAHANPSAALRKLVLLERLVMEELKGKPSDKATPRDEKGKFVPEKPEKTAAPEKRVTEAPAIGTEVSGRGAAPPDEIDSAAKNGDFRAFRSSANRRDLASRRG